ncbi:uncharacterized protein [Typha angustifolia]|uniref:uncharacterized protein n=1 Tax=Typha angustifolia TaxID=59011 RepID=UPI003C2B9E08
MKNCKESHFPKIYKEKFLEKYKEIDDAILAENFDYLQKLVSKNVRVRSTKNEDEEDVVNLSDDPLLSVVIAHKKSNLALRLVEVMSEENLKTKNIYGDTALHVAAAKKDVSVVEVIAMKDGKLMRSTNWKQETPLHKAAFYGELGVFVKLVNLGSDIQHRSQDGSTMLRCAVMGNAPDLAMEIARNYEDLMSTRNSDGVTPLQLLVNIPEAFRSKLQLGPMDSFIYNFTWIRQFVFNVLKQLFLSIQNLQEQKQNHMQTKKLIALLASEPKYWDFFNGGKDPKLSNEELQPEESEKKKEPIIEVNCYCQKKDDHDDEIVQWNDSPLILGAKMGLDDFVKQILTNFPQSAYNLDSDKRNVLQVAIKYGHQKIVKYIKSETSGQNAKLPSWLLSYVQPVTENTILHFAAEKIVKDEGFALQMKHELEFFEVK